MKRCDNCGWYNPDSATICEKCGERLPENPEPDRNEVSEEPESQGFTPAHPLAETEPRPVAGERRRAKAKSNYAATMMNAGLAFDSEKEAAAPGVCPKCHYPIAGNPETCPNCGASLRRATRQDAAHSGTAPQPAPATAPAPAQAPVSRAMMSTVREGTPQAAQAKASAAHAAPAAAYGKATIRDISKNLQQPVAPAPAPTPAPAPAPAPEPAPAPAPEPKPEPVRESREPEQVDVTFRLVPISDPDSRVIYLRVGDLVTIEGKRYRIIL